MPKAVMLCSRYAHSSLPQQQFGFRENWLGDCDREGIGAAEGIEGTEECAILTAISESIIAALSSFEDGHEGMM